MYMTYIWLIKRKIVGDILPKKKSIHTYVFDNPNKPEDVEKVLLELYVEYLLKKHKEQELHNT